MISKELLSEVIKRNIINIKTSLDDYIINENIVRYWDDKSAVHFEINIYELAHKCKEWALKQGYFIYSTNELAYIKTLNLEILPNVFSNGEDDETTCIFKACEYVLNQREKNNDYKIR